MHLPLFAGTNRHVVRIDARGGEELWRVQLPSSTWAATVTLCLTPDGVLAGGAGRCYCLDPMSGALRWQNDLPRTGWSAVQVLDADSAGECGTVCSGCGHAARPNAAFCSTCGAAIRPTRRKAPIDQALIATAGHVIAIDRKSGQEQWRRKLPGMSGLVMLLATDDRIFAAGTGRVHALQRAGGELLWTNGLPRLGYHFVTLAMPGASVSPAGPALAVLQQQQAAACAAS